MLSSCDKGENIEEDKIDHKQIRLAFIESEEDHQAHQVFKYNKDGLISEWNYNFTSTNITSSFEYNEDGSVITISSEEKSSLRMMFFNETLYLNPNGTACHAEGKVTLYESDYPLMKNYTVDFQYDSSNRLILIKISEKRTDFTGREESYPLKWHVEIDWNGDNIEKYSEWYSTTSRLAYVAAYTYYDGDLPNYKPIQEPILRFFYIPLQYQGVLGQQSKSLIKTKTASNPPGSDRVKEYSYDFSVSPNDSKVDKYYEIFLGKETEFTMGWQTIE